VICDRCGAALTVGAWPFCPHERGSFTNVPDDVPGGFVVENAWREPRTFYSQSEYIRALAADGMELNPHHVPGGKLANWATIDPQTLENARELVSRSSKATREASVTLDSVRWTTRTVAGSGRGDQMVVDL
jgi:hypothetical protein